MKLDTPAQAARIGLSPKTLERYAAAGGAPPEFLSDVMRQLVDLVLDDVVGRRVKALEAAQAVRQDARAAGAAGLSGTALIVALAARHGVSGRSIYRALCQRGVTKTPRSSLGRKQLSQAMRTWRAKR